MIKLGQEAFQNLEKARSKEWLETNGIGGFSSSTITGLNTRRYHGLLTAATKPPVGRFVLLSKFEETLLIDGRRYELSTNQYPGAVHPQGFRYQTEFRLDPFPVFTFEVEGVQLEKSVFMVQGENTTIVIYELVKDSLAQNLPTAAISLEIRPLIAFRDYHSTTHENGVLDPLVGSDNGFTTIKPYGDLPALHFAHDPAAVDANGLWYRNFQYAVEHERGLDFAEDLFSPCAFGFDLTSNARVRMIVSTERRDVLHADECRKEEIARRNRLSTDAALSQPNYLLNMLANAADQFLVNRAGGKTIIAGYHWFSDWGRDTMIALPGLTLATGRSDIAKSILAEFAKHVDQGMLPNRFPDAGETPEYNTVDATLWFFEAVRALLHYTNDYQFVLTNLYDVLTDIVDWHIKGTRYGIRVDSDDLLICGEPGVQLTWMDAKIGDWVVTPRYGKPVEIQALWYSALRVMEQLAMKFSDTTARCRYSSMAKQAFASFNQQFWNEEAGCLYDVVNAAIPDSAIRPNQILAISLRHSLVSQKKAASILGAVERHLLTPRGLRTLSPEDPNYIGRYAGDPGMRDAAYHQGTVWPWLMGHYISAYVKTFGQEVGRKFAVEWLTNFQDHLEEACFGQASEIFDGDAPHAPRGCVAQAWSVAELLRAAVEDVYVHEVVQTARVA